MNTASSSPTVLWTRQLQTIGLFIVLPLVGSIFLAYGVFNVALRSALHHATSSVIRDRLKRHVAAPTS